MTSVNTSKPRVRKFALIGLDGAGKTSALSALTLRRLAHPRGISARCLSLTFGIRQATQRMAIGLFPRRTAAMDIETELAFEFSVPAGTSDNTAGTSFVVEIFD